MGSPYPLRLVTILKSSVSSLSTAIITVLPNEEVTALERPVARSVNTSTWSKVEVHRSQEGVVENPHIEEGRGPVEATSSLEMDGLLIMHTFPHELSHGRQFMCTARGIPYAFVEDGNPPEIHDCCI
jgi:hypothetical protein